MFTASQIARARAATGARVGAEGAHDHSMRLVAAEAAAAAAAVAQAAVAAAAALRAEMELELEPAGGGSCSLIGCRRHSSSLERRCGRRGRSPVLQMVYHDSRTGTPWPMPTKGNYHE